MSTIHHLRLCVFISVLTFGSIPSVSLHLNFSASFCMYPRQASHAASLVSGGPSPVPSEAKTARRVALLAIETFMG